MSKWQPEWRDAQEILAEGKAQAKEESKLLFVHLGAPWCGWCHRLDDFLARHADRFGKDFVDVKIDTDRMRHGREVAAKLRGSNAGGIPWFAILDADGNTVATSDGPNGNVGFPAREEEIRHFMQMCVTTPSR